MTVLIVGAGPAGLTLAAELSLAGVPCRILEQRSERYPHSRAFALTPRCLEILDMRGEVDEFLTRGLPSHVISLGTKGRGIDMSRYVDSRHKYMLILPQVDTEEALEAWALKRGAVIERDTEVIGLSPDEEGVTVRVRDPEGERTERASFVVGCDGARSTVRELLGLSFPGTPSQFSAIIADVKLAHVPDEQVFARHTHRGMVAVMPFPDGHFRLMIQDHQRMQVPVSEPVTLAEIRRSAAEILGVDLGIHDPRWLSRFRSEQRLASRYRVGRVLLAGDAAHVHTPAGGQGLNLGIQDAMNLGWKLAATVHGWAPPDLLDTYEGELRPLASKVLKETENVFRFNTARGPLMRSARWLVKQLLLVPDLQRRVVTEMAGTEVRYGSGDHPMVGRRLPDAQLILVSGTVTSVFRLLHAGKPVFVDRTPGGRLAALAARLWPGHLITAHAKLDGADIPAAVLVRPDGHVAWASDRADEPGLREALIRWLGRPQGS
ncbi:putative FAD-dependent monooxygenase [Actinoplanes missouriensis 431]|uniref:Putative FAD-dependent monooxygenase n=1 Tax=Actinoplanes missouriensis (strain ATCC 14538 / DSM 43046 / CBS 188.64 / JCM 3121 / NBRC 102363 / NCIMB 12654 / NRRL B-3342 / UNCC 431) TaxID=512565 RepID=I0H609_ACTM4|nr:FAD-dependent monooxygenase [Actinoplanes missouriensis]BAL88446.1 putative FAD-dependent monooxygenase [Actinoplanes missouriensis 431]